MWGLASCWASCAAFTQGLLAWDLVLLELCSHLYDGHENDRIHTLHPHPPSALLSWQVTSPVCASVSSSAVWDNRMLLSMSELSEIVKCLAQKKYFIHLVNSY